MARVIELRPWDAEAYNLAGHAHRKLGDYERALAFYDQALDLNPHHRGALEYLGEAYLELDRPADAERCSRGSRPNAGGSPSGAALAGELRGVAGPQGRLRRLSRRPAARRQHAVAPAAHPAGATSGAAARAALPGRR